MFKYNKKKELEQLANRKELSKEDDIEINDGTNDSTDVTMSPTSKLKLKHSRPIENIQMTSTFERECQLYESSRDASKSCDRLLWWKVN